MTLTELVVYGALASLLLALLASLFVVGRRTSETTTANYFLSRDTETALNYLRRDLQQSALATLGSQKTPEVAIWGASALQLDDTAKLAAGENGNPTWTNQFYYRIVPGQRPFTGALERGVLDSTLIPAAPANLGGSSAGLAVYWDAAPTQWGTQGKQKHMVLNNVLLPSVKLIELGSSGVIDDYGGLRLRYVRRAGGEGGAETLADANPRSNMADFASNTKLVEVELKIMTTTSTGKPSYYSIKSRFCPLY